MLGSAQFQSMAKKKDEDSETRGSAQPKRLKQAPRLKLRIWPFLIVQGPPDAFGYLALFAGSLRQGSALYNDLKEINTIARDAVR